MTYEEKAQLEMILWRNRMMKRPSVINHLAKKLQTKINTAIPEKVHKAITDALRNMIKAVLFGAEFSNPEPLKTGTLWEREIKVLNRIAFYRNTAATEGAITGAGGIFLGLADFPIWLTLKLKMLFEIAAIYGMNTGKLSERIYMLYIFQLTFSSQEKRNVVMGYLDDWENFRNQLPQDINDFDWRSFQQEYRDYIDIAKLLQLIPGVGAAVGAVVNHRLTNKLGMTAMNAYRLRHKKNQASAWLSFSD